MLSHVTGKTKHEEATAATTTFDIIVWIRARRLKWLGQIMRLDDKDKRQIKDTLRVIYDNKQEGDILMDVQELSWDDLQKAADDETGWHSRVRELEIQAQRKTMPKHKTQTATRPPTKPEAALYLSPPCQSKNKQTSKAREKETGEEEDDQRRSTSATLRAAECESGRARTRKRFS